MWFGSNFFYLVSMVREMFVDRRVDLYLAFPFSFVLVG